MNITAFTYNPYPKLQLPVYSQIFPFGAIYIRLIPCCMKQGALELPRGIAIQRWTVQQNAWDWLITLAATAGIVVKWPSWRLKLPVNRVFVPQFVQTDNKRRSKARVVIPLRGGYTSDRWSVDFPHKSTVTQTMFPFDDVIMIFLSFHFQRSVIWSISFYCRPIVSTNKIIVDIISTYVCIRIYEIIIIVISQLQCQQSFEMWEGNVFPKVRCYPCTEQSSYCCLLSVLSTRPICTLFYTRRRDCWH